jgi:hypothetical protein
VRDHKLIQNLVNYFGCPCPAGQGPKGGNFWLDSKSSGKAGAVFTARKIDDLVDIIIPFFTKYPHQGVTS